MFFYAVAVGRKPGVYETWKECEEQVKAFEGAKFKKFLSEKDAVKWTKLIGEQAESIRASGGNLSPNAAVLAVKRNRKDAAQVNDRRFNQDLPASQIASSSRIVLDQQKKNKNETRTTPGASSASGFKRNGKSVISGLGVRRDKTNQGALAEAVPAEQKDSTAELLENVGILEE